jgi:hypothetical protein
VCSAPIDSTRRPKPDAEITEIGRSGGAVEGRSRARDLVASLAYRTGFYVGALYGYQLVSEVSPVDGPDFCQGFADGIEVIMSWLKRYLADGGTFDAALGDLKPYFPVLRSWVGDANGPVGARPARPPGRRERLRYQWEQEVCGVLSRTEWSTTKEIAERLNGRGPHSLRTLSQLLDHLREKGLVERSAIADVVNPRHRSVYWRLSTTASRGDAGS